MLNPPPRTPELIEEAFIALRLRRMRNPPKNDEEHRAYIREYQALYRLKKNPTLAKRASRKPKEITT